MPDLPTASVVIPTHGRSHMLEAILEPLLADPATTEVVVVADGDDRAHSLATTLMDHDSRIVAVATAGCGENGARQAGVERACGEVVVLLDDDVLAGRGLVKGHAAAHAGADGLVVLGYMPVAGARDGIAEELYALAYEATVQRYERDRASILRHCWAGNLSLRRADALRVGIDDSTYDAAYNADRDFGLRCARAGLSGVFRRELRATHLYRRTLDQLRRDAHAAGEGRWLIHRRHADLVGGLDAEAFASQLPPWQAELVRAARRPRLRAAIRPPLAAAARAGGPRRVRRVAAAVDVHIAQQAAASARAWRAARETAHATLPISVVVPAYNRAAMVERALRSVAAQTAPPSEVIVVDDHSTDATGEVATAFGARVVRHDVNRGEGAARNTGLHHATHAWVALLDSDDEWLPHHLRTLWSLREGHVLVATSCLAAGARARVFGAAGRRALRLRSPARVAHPDNCVPPSAALLRRDVALAVGAFEPGLTRCADLDLWLRMLEQGTGLAAPNITALYHVHDGQVSADGIAMQRAHLEVLDRYRDRPWCTPALLRRFEGLMAWDAARAEARAGRQRAALGRLARDLRDPRRLEGVAEALVWRMRLRRSARAARDLEASAR